MFSRATRLTIVWANPKPPSKVRPKLKRVETGRYTAVYLISSPGFSNRLAVRSTGAMWSGVTSATA